MGRRSTFPRQPRDFYRTPASAVAPLLPHLPWRSTFAEPCAGDGALVRHLEAAGHVCANASDIEPQIDTIARLDALAPAIPAEALACDADCFVTNPPWRRDLLHPLIVKLSDCRPTWLLLDAEWLHTRQAAPYLPRLRAIVSVGRVRWIEGSPHTGKDSSAWLLFDAKSSGRAVFVGRAA